MKTIWQKLLFICTLLLPCVGAAYQYELAVCTIFQDEARFLKEWIEFHRLVGAEHFILFNNLSRDDYAAVLAPYIETGIVELIDWPYESHSVEEWIATQTDAYAIGLEKAAGKAKWLAIIDSDEFLVPVKGSSLPHLLEKYQKYGGVCVYWQLYGTSGIQKIPDGELMIDLLTNRAAKRYAENRFIKSIVRPERVQKIASAHHAVYQKPYYAVDEDKKRLFGMAGDKVKTDKIRINHYWTRDEEFLHNVKIKRMFTGHHTQRYLEKAAELNREEDKIMQRFTATLSKILFSDTKKPCAQPTAP